MNMSNNNQTKNLKQKKFNYGLGFLKVISAFQVIRSHNFNYNSVKNKILLFLLKRRGIYVPSFFIMSFYFMHNDLISSNIKIYQKRIERLLIPYLFWPIIIYLINNYILNRFIKIGKYSLNDLKIQIIIGEGIISPFWFQWNLIIFTTIFFIIIYLNKKNYLSLIQILALISYFLHYYGYNAKFYHFLRLKKKFSLGRFILMLPFASTGFYLASLKIFKIISNYKIKAITYCIYFFFLFEKFNIKYSIEKYSGILINVRAICLIFIFSLFPSNIITNFKVEKIIKYIISYTAGVYYLHMTIILYLKNYIKPIRYGTLFGIFIIYIICYIISFIGIQLFGKTKFRYLFS